MLKDLLIKLANKIINKYGIHVLDINSIIQMHNDGFRITSYDLRKSLDCYSTLSLECVDIMWDYRVKEPEVKPLKFSKEKTKWRRLIGRLPCSAKKYD